MAGNQRVYRQRIRSTQTLQKVFNAMELIASSRIGQARRNAQEASPYDHALSHAVAALGSYARLDHPITRARTDTNRVAVLVVTSDRGMAGAYSATILRESEHLVDQLVAEGREPVLFTFGRRAQAYFSFRGREVEYSWTGESDRPSDPTISEVASLLLEYFLAPDPAGGVAEVHIVFTRYVSMVSQVPEVRRMLPLTVVDVDGPGERSGDGGPGGRPGRGPDGAARPSPDAVGAGSASRTGQAGAGSGPGSSGGAAEGAGAREDAGRALPLYEFEPSPNEVLGALLARYVSTRIRNALLQSAASELAARQQAMHTATDNAEDIITTYTRLANAARQGDITQEITEIVSGADALGAG